MHFPWIELFVQDKGAKEYGTIFTLEQQLGGILWWLQSINRRLLWNFVEFRSLLNLFWRLLLSSANPPTRNGGKVVKTQNNVETPSCSTSKFELRITYHRHPRCLSLWVLILLLSLGIFGRTFPLRRTCEEIKWPGTNAPLFYSLWYGSMKPPLLFSFIDPSLSLSTSEFWW